MRLYCQLVYANILALDEKLGVLIQLTGGFQRETNVRVRRIKRSAVIRRALDLSRFKGRRKPPSEFAVLHAQAVIAARLQALDIRLRPGMLQRVPE